MQQFPNAFEFNEYLLCVVLDHLYSCLFGTFLCNSDKERKDLKVKIWLFTQCYNNMMSLYKVVQQTQSLWSFINSKQRSLFLNPMYCKPLDSRVALFPIASIRFDLHWKTNEYMNY